MDSEGGLKFHDLVDKLRPKACVNPIKTVESRVVMRANGLSCVKI